MKTGIKSIIYYKLKAVPTPVFKVTVSPTCAGWKQPKVWHERHT